MKDNDDRALRSEYLQASVAALNCQCSELSQEFAAAASFRRSTPSRDEGWAIELISGISILAFLADLFAALLLSERISVLDAAQRNVSIAIVIACGIGLSAFAGEAIHRGRVDRSYRASHALGIVAVGAVGLVIIAVEWGLHIGPSAVPHSHGFELDGVTIGVAVLVVLLAPGIAFAHRERWSTMTSRRRAWKLRQTLRACERCRDKRYDELITLQSQLRVTHPTVRYDAVDNSVPQRKPSPRRSASP